MSEMKRETWVKLLKQTMAMGVGIVAVAMIGCGLLAWLACGEILPVEVAEYLVWAWMIGAVGIGCFLVARTAAKRRLVVAVCTAGVVIILLLFIKCIFFFRQPMNLVLPLGGFFITAILAGILASRKKTRRR